MVKFTYIIVVIIFLSFISSGCNKNAVIPKVYPSATPVPEKYVIEVQKEYDSMGNKVPSSFTEFGFNLFSLVSKEKKNENILISPMSASFSLSMLYNGSAGESRKALGNVLKINNIKIEELNKSNKIMIDYLENGMPQIEIGLASSFWGASDIKFKEDFINICKTFYKGDVNNGISSEVINRWVEEKSRGKIPGIIDKISPYDLFYILNVIYFKGIWMDEFDEKLTEERDFFLSNGTKKKVPMMSSEYKDYNYLKGDTFQAAEIPYKNPSVSMFIFLPVEKSSLKEFEKDITFKNWNKWMKSFKPLKGSIIMPRFKMECIVNFNNVMKSMGASVIYDWKKADLSNMCKKDVDIGPDFLADMVQKSFIEVNEKGTEAVTVTGEFAATGDISVPETFTMIVDRPFFFVIRENKKGNLLFLGSVKDPSYSH